MPQQNVRLTKDTMAVVNGVRLLVVPSGALVTVLPASNNSELVRRLYNGQAAEVSSQDLKPRAAPAPSQN